MPAAIGYALFQAGASLAVVNFVTIGIGAQLINLGVGLAVQAVAQSLLAPDEPAVGASNSQLPIKQARPPRLRSYGRLLMAGSVWWADVGNYGSIEDDLVWGQAFNDGEIGSIVQRYVDSNEVDIDGSNDITTSPYSTLATRKFYTHLGVDPESVYADIQTYWNIEARGDGVASLLVILDTASTAEKQQEIFPNGKPLLTVLFDASVIFDWRESAHDQEDPTTWEYSDNPVLALADFLTNKRGWGIPYSRISDNLAQWTAAADACEVQIDKKDGSTEDRYRISFTYALTESPKDVAQRILKSFEGKLWQKSDGSLGIRAGVFIPPTVTLYDSDIVSISVTAGQDAMTEVAGVRASFRSPFHDYQEQDADPWPNADILDYTDQRPIQLNLTSVPSHTQVRRLMKREYVRSTAEWRLSMVTSLAGLLALDETFVHLKIDEFGIDEDFEVVRFERNLGTDTCELEVVSVASSIDDWDEDTEEGIAPAYPHELDSSPVTVTLIASTFFNNAFACIDGDTSQNFLDSSYETNTQSEWVVAIFDEPIKVGRAEFYGSHNVGYINGSSPTVTITLRGGSGIFDMKFDAGEVSFTDSANEGDAGSGPRTIDNPEQGDEHAYTHWRMDIRHNSTDPNDDICITEFDLYKWVPV